MGRQQVQHSIVELGLGALATLGVASANLPIDNARENGTRLKKWNYAITWKDKTSLEGPIRWGFARGLTSTEIKEALDADPSGLIDIPATEQANRDVIPMGVIPAGVAVASEEQQIMRSARFPWKETPEGTGLQLWAQNIDGSTLTTGMLVTLSSSFVFDWMED